MTDKHDTFLDLDITIINEKMKSPFRNHYGAGGVYQDSRAGGMNGKPYFLTIKL